MNSTLIIPEGTTTITESQFLGNSDIEEIIIPDSVTIIEDEAFKDCKNLKHVTLSNNLVMIGCGVFSGCSSLKEITIPTSLTYFSHSLFKDCTSLETINVHDGIIYFDDYACCNCTNLKNFKFPLNLKSLGIRSMFGINGIEEITIPKYVNTIENAALACMMNLKKIYVDKDNQTFMSDEDVGLIDKNEGLFIQYAIAADRDEYVIGYYDVNYGDDDSPIKSSCLMYNILNYALAGAKKIIYSIRNRKYRC